MKPNIVLINCCPRHIQFANQICDSLEDTINHELNCNFIFVMNEVKDGLELIEALKDIGLEKEYSKFTIKSQKIGSLHFNDKYRFELGSLRYFLKFIKKDYHKQILLTQCTHEFLDYSMFSIIFDESNSEHVLGMANSFQNYFLKIPIKIIEDCSFANPKTKEDSVRQESQFVEYLKNKNVLCKTGVLGNPKIGQIISRFGRNNKIEENKFFRKWKGTWNTNMIPNAWV